MKLSRWLFLLIFVLLFFLIGGAFYTVSQINSDSEYAGSAPSFPSPMNFLQSPSFHLRHHEGEHAHRYVQLLLKQNTYRHWIVGWGLNMDFPVSDWNSAYDFGTGMNVEVAYALTKSWVMGIGMTFMNYSGSFYGIPLTDQDMDLHLLTRVMWGKGGIEPYVTAQAGGIWQTSTALGQTAQEVSPTVGLGAGVELGVDETFDLYCEALFDLIMGIQGTAWDIPISTGVRLKI